MHWFATGLLIALAAGTAAWTGYLLRRLFVVAPADPGPPRDPDAHDPDVHGPDASRTTAEEPNA